MGTFFARDQPLPCRLKEALFQGGLNGREDEEVPNDVAGSHRDLDTRGCTLVGSRAMAGHIAADRILKIADGTEYLTQEEVEHVKECIDCVNAIAELVRKRIAREQAE